MAPFTLDLCPLATQHVRGSSGSGNFRFPPGSTCLQYRAGGFLSFHGTFHELVGQFYGHEKVNYQDSISSQHGFQTHSRPVLYKAVLKTSSAFAEPEFETQDSHHVPVDSHKKRLRGKKQKNNKQNAFLQSHLTMPPGHCHYRRYQWTRQLL
eukprot:scaffold8230_cov94-Cylindrotheca_fusiformis.AAC.1